MKINSGITSPDRILFPHDGFTKLDLIDYYAGIAPTMLPYMKDRMLTMQRFPEGIDTEGFYQKDAPDYFPAWIKTVPVITQEGKTVHYVICNNAKTLIYLANFACITPHLCLSRFDQMHTPDHIIFDLDPSQDKDFASVKRVARTLKKVLDTLELPTFLKTTGSRGLHVVVPIKRQYSFEVVRQFAHDVAQIVVMLEREHATLEVRTAKRAGKVFIDVLRNSFGATAVAPYAVRARAKAPVALPIFWEDLENPRLQPTTFTINNVHKRLEQEGDAWKTMKRAAISLAHALREIETHASVLTKKQ